MSRWQQLLIVAMTAMSLLLTGCIQAKLKRLEIRQLESQLQGMRDTASFLRTTPTLGSSYGGRLFVSGDVLNRYLDGLRDYSIPLPKPRGAVLRIESVKLQFTDGPPQIDVAVRATNRDQSVEVKLKMRADLVMTAHPDDSTVGLHLQIREVVPEVRLSILRLRELFFVAGLLRLEGQEYLDSLPRLSLPLQLDLPLAFDPPDRAELQLGSHAKLFVKQRLPGFSLAYRYRAQQVLTLADGIHVFFSLEEVK
jgi:hypothetical protein